MIDRQTIDRILDAANIVDVVSEFVTLRKSGMNYKGLCPFHDDTTPSFYVSPSRNICKCFSCGKGGTPVSFIMEHEQMTYPEALRWLAAKYHIEIHERELTSEEQQAESERESMYIVNEWAAGYFEDTLRNTADGVAYGMQYFRSRGIRDDIMRRFRLGYSLPQREALPRTAQEKGYKAEFLLKTGLCYSVQGHQSLADRFAGRVIFPWIGMSGKVVAFGGRKLDQATKGVQQKYVNSPDSEIYHKEQQLYGIYQAKKAIAKENCVYMVEGYTDVISMHQSGIENVVANSGTALSVHQIRMLRRFTPNVVLLYDGDDPDSFARKHTAKDFREYVEKHQQDFIDFKIDVMLRGVSDPIKRAEAVNSIIQSISMIKDQIVRATYINLCVQRLGINEPTIISTLNKFIRKNLESEGKHTAAIAPETPARPIDQPLAPATPQEQGNRVERLIAQLVVRHGEKIIYRDVETEDGDKINLSVAQYISYDLCIDDLHLKNPVYARILEEATEHSTDDGFIAEQYFTMHQDVELSNIAAKMVMDVPLTKSLQINSEEESLHNEAEHLVLDFRKNFIEDKLVSLKAEISKSMGDNEKLRSLMLEYAEAQKIRNELARKLGNDIVS